jgi:hypothetical protein
VGSAGALTFFSPFARPQTIQYDVGDLFQYVDELADLSCLIYSDKSSAYEPFGREWIKKTLLNRLKSMSKPSK